MFRISIILATITLSITGTFYWYYQDTQKRMDRLRENNAVLETAVQMNEETIDALETEYALITNTLREVNEEFAEIRSQNRELRDRLSDNDIGFLAYNRPELVERIINRASENAFRCLEIISGAELTEEENNATTAQSFNSECPWLWSGGSTSE